MVRTFSKRSEKSLGGVHPSLVAVVRKALKESKCDFTVVEGVRSLEQQRQNFEKGFSKTMKSYHLVQKDGFGHAVDLYPYFAGSVQVNAPFEFFLEISEAMKSAAKALGVKITWGGDWKTFKDTPHFQIEL